MGSDRHTLTRRDFVRTGVALGATVAAASCTGDLHVARRRVRGACAHDCPDTCAWLMTVENGRAVSVEGDPAHPYTRGRLCNAMDGFVSDVVNNPDRILHPLKRTGPKGEAIFKEIGWGEALEEVATRLQEVIERHGAEAILPYNFAGTMGVAQGWSLSEWFFRRLGATRLEHAICGSTAGAGLAATLGTDSGILQEDLLHSRMIVMWGGNPVVTNPHGWTIVQEARRAGARLVVIDPLRSPTAAEADLHLRPRPGTDTALALGLMHVIVAEGLHDADYLERHAVGFDALRGRLAAYPPERVAERTGVDASAIVALARDYAGRRPAAIQLHIGLEKHRHGAMTYRTIACLPAIVGAWRERGGGLVYGTSDLFNAALDWTPPTGADAGPEVRTINMAQLGLALTDPSLDPPVQALIVYNSNPAAIAPNQNRVLEGLRRDDLFTVVLEHFVTDTALHADYVFPATTQAEHLDLIVPYGSRYLTLNLPAIEPRGEALPNTEFFRRLATRLGFDEPWLQTTDEELIRNVLRSDHPALAGITFERLREEGWAPLNLPEPRLPFAEGGFPTPSGKCELYSESWRDRGLDPLPGLPDDVPGSDGATPYPLHFMSPKWNRYFINSSHANQPRLERAAGRPRLRIHPTDAAARGIADGDRVRVFNERGEVALSAEVTDAALPGVVFFLHGWWASRIGGASANALTGDRLADDGGGSTMHDTRVEVAPLA